MSDTGNEAPAPRGPGRAGSARSGVAPNAAAAAPASAPTATFRKGMTPCELEAFIDHAIENMTLREKIRAMHGRATLPRLAWDVLVLRHYNRRPYAGGGVRRFGIPPLRFTDGPRGVSAGNSTCFPAAMARGATWNVSLQERVGDVIGRECRANGATYYGGVCVNLLTHPAGGRAQESYGEAPHLIGEMGAALVRGVQHHNVMACVKHYACNNIEDTRFKVDVDVDERTLREVYLPHFRKCIDAGAASVMAAYNRVRGEWCCEHGYLLSTILKGEWGFEGFVMSDFNFGIHSAEAAADGGLDIEMGGRKHFNMRRLGAAVRAGRVDMPRINDAVRRTIGTTLAFANREDPERYDRSRLAAPEHTALAREVAEEAMVLLKNEPSADEAVLPLSLPSGGRLALLGRLAESENLGDHGSSSVYPPYVITAADGVRAAAEERDIELTVDSRATGERAARHAAAADAAIVVVGLDHRDEGEGGVKLLGIGGDRDNLGLHAVDIDLIQTVARANPRTVVVLIGGSAITVGEWEDAAAAIVMAWYPGMEGGAALARVLFGEANPAGRLPFAVPAREADLPAFDHESEEVRYDYFHGYEYLDRAGIAPRFPFGYGLSYTSFAFARLRARRGGDAAAGGDGPEGAADGSSDNEGRRGGAAPDGADRAGRGEGARSAAAGGDGTEGARPGAQADNEARRAEAAVVVTVDVTNTGSRRGATVVQCYIGWPDSRVERPVRRLHAFEKVWLDPGETRTVELTVPRVDLAYYDAVAAASVQEEGRLIVYVGPWNEESVLLTAEV